MRKLIPFDLILALTKVYGQNPEIYLIPQPVEIQQTAGKYLLTMSSTIGFNNAAGSKTAEMLAQKLKELIFHVLFMTR